MRTGVVRPCTAASSPSDSICAALSASATELGAWRTASANCRTEPPDQSPFGAGFPAVSAVRRSQRRSEAERLSTVAPLG